MNVVVLDAADADVADAALRYEQLQEGLGLRFLDEVDRIYRRLEVDAPFAIAPFRRYRSRVIRRLFIRHFPYRVFFIDEPDIRLVVGVPHDRQRAYWLKRIPRP